MNLREGYEFANAQRTITVREYVKKLSDGMMKSLHKPEAVLFDLDGTLVDSVPDLAWCVNAMMRQLSLPERRTEDVALWVGNGVKRLIERAIDGRLDGKPDPEAYSAAEAHFRQAYAEHYCCDSQLYPHVADTLRQLHEEGLKLGCVTNKPEAFTLPILAELQLATYFDVVVGGDTLPVRKPSPEPLWHAADALGADRARVLFVGDSETDVACARAAAVPVVCVSYGYNHGRDICEAEPDLVIHDMAELKSLL